MIVSDAGLLYTGITTDIERRWRQHLSGCGARYFRAQRPLAVVYLEQGHDRASAARREAAIKRLPAAVKRTLPASAANALAGSGLAARLRRQPSDMDCDQKCTEMVPLTPEP
jgi:putative endonuclease